MIENYYEGISKEIEGKFRRVAHLLTKSNLKSGEYQEEILRNTLSNFLSSRFSVKTGYIWFNDEKQSKQIDILIIDEDCAFGYIFKEMDFAIVRPEAVVAIIEVKTVLKLEQLVEAFENIATAKKLILEARGFPGHLISAVFGYESNKVVNPLILDGWFKSEGLSKFESNDSLWPEIIFFFQNNHYLFLDPNNRFKRNVIKRYYYQLYREGPKNLKAWQMSLLIQSVIAACEGTVNSGQLKVKPFKSIDLINFKDAMVSFNAFRPQDGHLITESLKE